MLAPRPLAESFYTGLIVQRLRELGYREGSGMVLEYRATRAVPQRYPEMAHELVALKCDLIFAVGPDNGVIALRDARTSIPVVFLAIDFDPLQSGIVTSLGRPGSNITGVYVPQGELAAKPRSLRAGAGGSPSKDGRGSARTGTTRGRGV